MYQSLRMLATAQDSPSKPNLPVCAVALSPWFPCGFVLHEYRLIELNLNGGQTNSKYIFFEHIIETDLKLILQQETCVTEEIQ